MICSGWRSLGADQLDVSVRAEEWGRRGAATLPSPGDAAGVRPPQTALASSHFPHTGALPPLISVVAGMHCCLFVVLLRED